MYTFRQYVEALASHGGYWFQKDQPSAGKTATGKDMKWSFPDYASWSDLKHHKTIVDLESEKTHKVLTRNYKNVISKLDEKLMKLGDIDFHIYFGLPENIKNLINNNYFNDRAEITTILEDYFFKELNISKKDIVFVKSGPSGDLLTPWMILHSIGHAITDSNIIKPYDTKWNDLWSLLDEHFEIFKSKVLSCLFNFRSARVAANPTQSAGFKNVADLLELRHELVASYLWNGGRIKRPTPECIENLKGMPLKQNIKPKRLSDEQMKERLVKVINKFYNESDKLIKESLDSLRGHVLIDLFPYVSELKNI